MFFKIFDFSYKNFEPFKYSLVVSVSKMKNEVVYHVKNKNLNDAKVNFSMQLEFLAVKKNSSQIRTSQNRNVLTRGISV